MWGKILFGDKLKRFNLDFLLLIFNVLALSLFLPRRFLLSYNELMPWLVVVALSCLLLRLLAYYQYKCRCWWRYVTFNNLALKLLYLLLGLLVLPYFHAKPLDLLAQSQRFKQDYSYKNYVVKIEKVLKKQDFYAFIGAIWHHDDGKLVKNLVYFTLNPKFLDKNSLPPNKDLTLELKTGELYLVKAKLKASYSRLNFGGFNRAKWLYAQEIVASGAVKQINVIKHSDEIYTQLPQIYQQQNSYLSQARENLLAKIDQFYQQHKLDLPNFSIVFALAFGERFYLSNIENDLYRKAGIAHLIAISGLHIGLAFLFGYLLLRAVNNLLFFIAKSVKFNFFNLTFSSLNLASCIFFGLLFALFYSYLADFSITVNRAVVSLFIIYLFVFTRTNNSNWVKFNKVVAVLILSDPLSLLSDSLWLSLGAIFCLILWSKIFPIKFLLLKNKVINHDNFNKIQLYCLKIIHIQIGFLFLFTPIILYFFSGFSISSFLINLLAIPLFSLLLVPLILLAVVFTILGMQLDFLYFLSDKIIGYFNLLLLNVDPLWFWLSQATSWWIFCGLLLAIILLSGWLGYATNKNLNELKQGKNSKLLKSKLFKPDIKLISLNYEEIKTHFSLRYYLFLTENFKHKTIIIGLFSLCAMPLSYYIYQQHNQPNWQYYNLDIGQGLSNLIVKNKHAILYDTGAAFGEISMFQLEVEPLLKRLGLTLDYFIVSHDDNDHSGAATKVISEFKPPNFINTSERTYGFRGKKQNCVVGNDFSWQNLKFKVLNPVKMAFERANNDHSCMLLITDENNFSLLLTGDITTNIEQQLLGEQKQLNLNAVDVLQVPHHGSKTSSSYAFLQYLNPKLALNSSGYNNHFHHPNKDVLARYHQLGIDFYDSAEVGASRVDFYNDYFTLSNSKNLDSPWYVF